VKSQITVIGYIERFWNNFEKIGKENFSHICLMSWLNLLKSYWAQKLKLHEVLLRYKDILRDHWLHRERWFYYYTGILSYDKIKFQEPPAGLEIWSYLTLRSLALIKTLIKTQNCQSSKLMTTNLNNYQDLFKLMTYVDEILAVKKMQHLKGSLKDVAAEVIGQAKCHNLYNLFI